MSEQFSGGLVIRVREDEHGEKGLLQLREIVRGYPGKKRLRLRLDLAEGGQVLVDSCWPGVDPNAELNERVDQLLGKGNRFLERAATQTRAVPRRARAKQ